MTFHQLCDWFVKLANQATGRDLVAEAKAAGAGQSHMEELLPYALDIAINLVDERYAAIVIDEAQDFKDEYWMPVDTLIQQASETALILYDHNQRIFSVSELFPIEEPPFLLTKNCRNTDEIHKLAYQYYEGETTEPSSIEGEEPEIITGPTRSVQAKKIASHIVERISKQEVSPEEICVLVPSQQSESYFELLAKHSLPTGTKWAPKEFGKPDSVCIETVMRFKGLESTCIYFWGADEFSQETDIQLLYVTLSRAKSRLCLIGDQTACVSLLQKQG